MAANKSQLRIVNAPRMITPKVPRLVFPKEMIDRFPMLSKSVADYDRQLTDWERNNTFTQGG